MAKFRKKLISATEPLATAAGIRSPVEQLQDLNALSISVVTVCADTSGTDGGLADDTAINTAGGFVKITGTGFRNTAPTTIVYINGVTATYNYLSSTSIVVTVPAATAGTTASLIVFNGSTVGSIWAAGISYSGFPSWTTTAASNNGLVVSTQLVAVGDAPLVYTFVSGTLPPNCTISSSGLLSGTVTGVSTNVIYTFTVAVTDAQNQNVSQSIVYTLVVSDFYYRYTSLHISGDSNPTWITDASTNALAVAPAGAPQSTIFSPLKAGYYGNYFNDTYSWLETNTTQIIPATGDFTIEAWIYVFGMTYAWPIVGQGTNGDGGRTYFAIDTSNRINVQIGASSLTSTGTITRNKWTHVVWSRTGSANSFYIDGIAAGTVTLAGTIQNTTFKVAGLWVNDTFTNGYISNLRVTSTIVYSANFTPSTSPLTAITGTKILTCQSNRFIDNSAAPATITANGTPKVVSSNPFNLPAGLAAYGSGYFNGSPTWLSIPLTAALTLGSVDFTIEAWIYKNTGGVAELFGNTAAINYAIDCYATNNSNYPQMSISSNGTTTTNIVGGTVIATNRWYHIAWVRSGTTINIYVNGVLDGTGVFSGAVFSGGDITVSGIGARPAGGAPDSWLNGYISNLRIVKGTAVYTAAFTPSTTPLTAITNTSLLTLQTNVPHNNSQFRDTSTNNALITRYGNTTQGSFSPFTKQYPYSTATVGGSAYFDGTGDYLAFPNDPAFSFASSNFTIECWINVTSTSNYHIYVNSDSANNLGVTLYVGSGTVYTYVTAPAGNIVYGMTGPASSVVSGVWTHVAFVRNGSTFTNYVNGVAGTSVTSASAMPDSQVRCYIGTTYNASTSFSGYISNYRVVKGTAVYTSNFTPSTAPLTAISGTVLLMPFTNAAVYDNTMLNNFETGGNVQVNTSTFKYGTGAIRTGSGNYLLTPMKDSYQFGSGDFTVETWAYIVNNVSSATLIDCAGAGGNFGWFLEYSSARGLFFYMGTGSSGSGATYNTTPALSTWTHLAVARQSGTVRMFINGALVNTTSLPNSSVAVQPLAIGAANNYTTTYYLDGYMDEIRITKGFARYTATFTPATGAYSVSAPFGTSILPSKSLRFRRSANTYLSKTFAVAGNRTTWTWSGWIKRGILGATSLTLFGAGPSSNTDFFYFGFEYSSAADKLVILDYPSASSLDLRTTQVFRDPAAWYHIVLSVDTTQAASTNRVKLYVNGVQVTSFSTATYPSQNSSTRVNSADVHNIGSDRFAASPNYTFDGEMAEVNFVDGLALEPTMFGAYSTYGQWLPVSYSGYMGANGFYLPFNAATTTASANYLLVGGGGGGGQVPGGGGGGGGFRTGSSVTLDPTSVYAISVGAGGAGSTATWPSTANAASPGGGSTFNSLTAAGGGRGGADGSVQAAGSGGSGGGASGGYQSFNVAGGAGNTPSTSPSQGNSGGNSSIGYVAGASAGAGGGGGAGGTGSPGSVIVTTTYAYGTGTSGDGGAGAVSSISGTSVTYAGGGGGGGASATAAQQGNPAYRYLITAGVGGTGGGAAGTTENVLPVAATANLGGGGGGSGHTTGYYGPGGAGGSGVVIISYSGTQKFYGGNVTSVGGNTIHTFTTSGSLTGIFGDQSGNNNNWTPNNINVSTVGPTYDLLTDVPTLTSATAANYAVLNPLEVYGMTLTDGNLKATAGTTAHYNARSTIYMPSSGKWYFEGQATSVSNPGQMSLGLVNSSIAVSTQAYAAGYYSIYFGFSGATTNLYINNNGTSSSANSISAAISDITQVAYDATTGKLWLGYNNSWKNSSGATDATANPGTGTNPTMTISTAISLSPFIHFYSNSGTINFGQQPFTYTPPANFLALNTYNI